MRCNNCKRNIDDEALVCPHCNTIVKKSNYINADESTLLDKNIKINSFLVESKKEKRQKRFPVLFILMILIIISTLLYLTYQRNEALIYINKTRMYIQQNIDSLKSYSTGEYNISIKTNGHLNTVTGKYSTYDDFKTNGKINEKAEEFFILSKNNNLYVHIQSINTKPIKIQMDYFKSYIDTIYKSVLTSNFEKKRETTNFRGEVITLTKYAAQISFDEKLEVFMKNKNFYRLIYSKNNNKFQIELSNSKYFFDYFIDDKNILSGSLKWLVDSKNSEIDMTFDVDDYVRDINISIRQTDSYESNNTINDYISIDKIDVKELLERLNKLLS